MRKFLPNPRRSCRISGDRNHSIRLLPMINRTLLVIVGVGIRTELVRTEAISPLILLIYIFHVFRKVEPGGSKFSLVCRDRILKLVGVATCCSR